MPVLRLTLLKNGHGDVQLLGVGSAADFPGFLHKGVVGEAEASMEILVMQRLPDNVLDFAQIEGLGDAVAGTVLGGLFYVGAQLIITHVVGGHDDHLGLGADMHDDFHQLQAVAIP